MKKRVSKKQFSGPPQVEPNIAELINRMVQQLTFLEKKIDTLIARPQEAAPAQRHFSKPYQRSDRPDFRDRGRQDGAFRERSLHKAVCADCKKECEVPFRPTGDRPVYCRDCFSKRKTDVPFNERSGSDSRDARPSHARHFDKHSEGGHRKFSDRKRAPARGRKR